MRNVTLTVNKNKQVSKIRGTKIINRKGIETKRILYKYIINNNNNNHNNTM